MTVNPDAARQIRTVVIGGTSGIGLATARQLAAAGHQVTIVGRSAERLNQALASIEGDTANTPSGSGQVLGRTADLCDRAQLDALYAETGPFDHLVIAAPGTGSVGTLAQLDLEAFAKATETKLIATAHAVQAALPYLPPTGSITLVTAASAQAALPGTAGLAAVNGALETMVPVLALELAPIRVNAVSPGIVDTPWWDRVLPAEARAAAHADFAKSLPVGRVGRPEEIADVIALLVRNGYMTGTVVPCDGGGRLKP